MFEQVLKERFCDPFAGSKSRGILFNLFQGRKTVSRLLEIMAENIAIIGEVLTEGTNKFIFRRSLNKDVLLAIPASAWSQTWDTSVATALQVEHNLRLTTTVQFRHNHILRLMGRLLQRTLGWLVHSPEG
jgi:hypothetical protein